MKWQTIISFTYPQEAYVLKTYLQSEGIAVFLKDENLIQVYNFYSNAVGGVKVQVPEDQVELAVRLLNRSGYQVETSEPDVVFLVSSDQKTAEPSCPFCHSSNVGKSRQPNWVTVVVYAFLGVFFPIFRKIYQCFSCHRKWKYVRKGTES